ncbi:LA2681 family HEPN domain-containing protein [Pseudescherichia sp.]|uniref:LA2681 family HEPN domain-containing protein n=1 Tax=Pseudescherichia sp. TaxID=2055881 RepID=UPI0028AD8FC0|nr:LA2681 family HEPN domain-containing protein [Pseudescherichia sp.]
MADHEKNEITKDTLEQISNKADELIQKGDRLQLERYTQKLTDRRLFFADLIDEARFLYIIGNCHQVLYQHREMEWYSDDLSKAAIFFRNALSIVNKLAFPNQETLFLKSCIETNLANSLSAQGRAFCCIPLWDKAISQNNPVAMICKAQNELFLANILYDPGHQEYHLFVAYKLIIQGLKYKNYLYEEQQVAFHEDGELMKFKNWFEHNLAESSFKDFEAQRYDFDTKKQKSYLTWCGENNLFINDLNDVLSSEVVYQDIVSLPSFSYKLNQSLSMHETLMYHGNFDELKNDYCYSRYLFYTALNIPQEAKHFFNDTYPHVEDMSHSLTNLKSSHYKSAFRTLYSLFDKISYFLHRFLELNDIKDDNKITFDSIFRDISKRNAWVPHPRLKMSKNPFIHALFYILKDIRDVKDATPTTRWLDPEAKSFAEIRNALEHRSLKIIDDFGYTLTQLDKEYTSEQLKNYIAEKDQCALDLEKLYHDIKHVKGGGDSNYVTTMSDIKSALEIKKKELESLIDEQHRLSTHSLLITVSEFESRTLTLMRLARNSIIYLSLAIHYEEQCKPKSDGLVMPTVVPLR